MNKNQIRAKRHQQLLMYLSLSLDGFALSSGLVGRGARDWIVSGIQCVRRVYLSIHKAHVYVCEMEQRRCNEMKSERASSGGAGLLILIYNTR
jgi:hypothetical protein